MEREIYTENLAKIYEYFGKDTTLIPLRRAAEYVRLDARTLQKQPKLVKQVGRTYYIPAVTLARWLSIGG